MARLCLSGPWRSAHQQPESCRTQPVLPRLKDFLLGLEMPASLSLSGLETCRVCGASSHYSGGSVVRRWLTYLAMQGKYILITMPLSFDHGRADLCLSALHPGRSLPGIAPPPGRRGHAAWTPLPSQSATCSERTSAAPALLYSSSSFCLWVDQPDSKCL